MTDNAELVTAFTELYGTAPEGVWAAPGRVNLIGEYTDFNDGFVMPLALPHTAVAAVARREDHIEEKLVYPVTTETTDHPGG
ncbi:galactokinase family protein, partial [Streptomyces sp. NPDC059744]|uniref:galactokinase family protein n=1 Tax=Streptomyces sp. NPDC059744 TaxID=3346929 RepID=UPI0036606CB4